MPPCTAGSLLLAGVTPFRPSKNPNGRLLPSPPHRREDRSPERRGIARTTQPSGHRGCLVSSWAASQAALWSPSRLLPRGAHPLPQYRPFLVREDPRRTPGPASLSSVLVSVRTFQSQARQTQELRHGGGTAARLASARGPGGHSAGGHGDGEDADTEPRLGPPEAEGPGRAPGGMNGSRNPRGSPGERWRWGPRTRPRQMLSCFLGCPLKFPRDREVPL